MKTNFASLARRGACAVDAQFTYRFENNTPYTFTYQLKGDPFKLGEVVNAPPGDCNS